MAGKNSRLNRFMQMIGIVDVPQEEEESRDSYGRGPEMDGYRDRDRGRGDAYGRDSRYEPAFGGYSGQEYSSSRQAGPRYAADEYAPRSQQRTASFDGYASRGNVTPMPPRGEYRRESYAGRSGGSEQAVPRAVRSEGRQRTVIYAIHRMEECQDVISDLIAGKTLLINLEELPSDYQQRVVDTLSGASFALNAVLRKASDRIYLIAPSNVEVNDRGPMERRY